MTGHSADRLDAFIDGELDGRRRPRPSRIRRRVRCVGVRSQSRRALSVAIQGALPRFTALASFATSSSPATSRPRRTAVLGPRWRRPPR